MRSWQQALLGLLAAFFVGVPQVSAAEPCPNEAIREAQGSTFLPECRAWEMVSPVDKAGTGVFGQYTNEPGPASTGGVSGGTYQLTDDGDGLLYAAPGPFPGVQSAPGFGMYLSARSATGWSTTPTDPPVRSDATWLRVMLTFAMSVDGTRAVVYSTKALAPGAVEGARNIYVRDISTGTYELIASHPKLANWSEQGGNSNLVGVSPDLSTVAFRAGAELIPGMPEGGTYLWRRGEGLSSVATEGDGSPSPTGGLASDYTPSISKDGRRVLFVRNASLFYPEGLFLSEPGEPVVQISASQRSGDDPSALNLSKFVGASDDLSVIYFLSKAPLTEDSTADEFDPSLFRYDVNTGELTDLLADIPYGERRLSLEPAGQVSPDGSTVSFEAAGAYSSQAEIGGRNVYIARGGQVKFLGARALNDPLTVPTGQFSEDGRFLAFEANTNLTEYSSEGPSCVDSGGSICTQIFVYDVQNEALSCASCNPTGEAPRGYAFFRANQLPGLRYLTNTMTDDGKVAFESSDPLVKRDVNGARDVYTWQNGHLELVSSGVGESDSLFAGMSADGSTIAFVTAQQLVRQDTDRLQDAYVARIDGGFTGQMAGGSPVAECSGAGCQGDGLSALTRQRNGSELVRAPAASRRPRVAILGKTGSGKHPSIRVRVSGAGVVRVTGHDVKTASKKTLKAGSFRIPIELKRSARIELDRKGRLWTKLVVRFQARSGEAARVRSTLALTRSIVTNSKGGK